MLKGTSDRRIQKAIAEKINTLAIEPQKHGKVLIGELTGYRTLRAAGQRYRIIYRIEEKMVIIVAIGIRKEGSKADIYSLAKKLIKLGLLDAEH